MLVKLIVRHEGFTHPFDKTFNIEVQSLESVINSAEANSLESVINVIKHYEKQGLDKTSLFYEEECILCNNTSPDHEIITQEIPADVLISGRNLVKKQYPSRVLSRSSKSQSQEPTCSECGEILVRNGACYKCLNCGATSGCS